jgi:hypothetical protein
MLNRIRDGKNWRWFTWFTEYVRIKNVANLIYPPVNWNTVDTENLEYADHFARETIVFPLVFHG